MANETNPKPLSELHAGSKWVLKAGGEWVRDADGGIVAIEPIISGSKCLVIEDEHEERAYAYAEDVHAVLERGGFCPHAKPPVLSDVEFEAHVRAQGFKPTLEQLAFIRAGFELPGRAAEDPRIVEVRELARQLSDLAAQTQDFGFCSATEGATAVDLIAAIREQVKAYG